MHRITSHLTIGANVLASRHDTLAATVQYWPRTDSPWIVATRSGILDCNQKDTSLFLDQTLAELLLPSPEAARLCASAIAPEYWQTLVDRARELRIVPQLAARIREINAPIPENTAFALRRAAVEAFTRTAPRVAKALDAITKLEAAGIRVAVFKGVAAIGLLYGKPDARTVNDADLILNEHDLPRALEVLAASGFARKGDDSLEQYSEFVQNAPGFAGNRALAVYGPAGAELDLHWGMLGAGMGPAELLERRTCAQIHGLSFPVVDPSDGLLLTIHHALREHLSPEGAFRDLLDVQRWTLHLNRTQRLPQTARAASEHGLLVPALAVAAILAAYDSDSSTARFHTLLRELADPQELESAKRLEDLFAYQLEHGKLSQDILYLVHGRPWQQIFAGLADWKKYRESMRSIESELGREQTLRQRAGQLARSVPGLRGLRLARELARAKYDWPKPGSQQEAG